MYWGLLIIAMYFSYLSKEKWISFIYPVFLTLLMALLGRFAMAGMVTDGKFPLQKNEVSDITEFAAGIDLVKDADVFLAHFNDIFKIGVVILLGAVVIWLIFGNRWLRNKIKNQDLCEALMFAISAIVLIGVNFAVSAGMGYACADHQGVIILSAFLAYIITRPFSVDEVAASLVTKRTAKHRKDGAIDFTAMIPKGIKGEDRFTVSVIEKVKTLKENGFSGIVIESQKQDRAEELAEFIAKELGYRIIRIRSDVFEKLYKDDRERSFEKIFEDAKVQAPAIICFYDSEEFFGMKSGEYGNRDRKIFLGDPDLFTREEKVKVVCITKDRALLDDVLIRENILDKSFSLDEDKLIGPEDGDEKKEEERKRRYSGPIALAICIIGFAALGYWLYGYFIGAQDRYDIQDVKGVETAPLATEGDWSREEVYYFMSTHRARYYYMDESEGSALTLYQTDKETFADYCPMSVKKMCLKVGRCVEEYFWYYYKDGKFETEAKPKKISIYKYVGESNVGPYEGYDIYVTGRVKIIGENDEKEQRLGFKAYVYYDPDWKVAALNAIDLSNGVSEEGMG